ncbi:MAG: hypothetical protein KF734_17520 [Saprospiraceae bacterium]|nr:hypothetical protein [Saprospiraceae bacterium]
MNEKILPFAICLLMWAVACQKENTPAEPQKEQNTCLQQQFSKRLKKTVTTLYYWGTNLSPDVRTAEYFFDAQNRVDSIFSDNIAVKILYAPTGEVDKKLVYYWGKPQNIAGVTHYHYQNGQVVKFQTFYYAVDGTLQNWSTINHFEWNAQGFLEKTWLEGGNDKTVFTVDDCGNILKTQDFYNDTNLEHRLEVAEYADTYSPYYLIGLHKIYPGYHSVHNPIFNQIVHWDCADYDPSPIHSEYEYDADGLPIKMSNPYRTIEFFYE